MAATKQQSSASRSRNGSGAKSATRARTRAATKPAAKKAAAKKDATPLKDGANAVATTASDTLQVVGGAVKAVAVPVGTAVLGAAGGLAAGKLAFGKRKKVLGITLPGQRKGMDGLAKNIGEAGKQLGKVAAEVHEARRKAQEVGKALS